VRVSNACGTRDSATITVVRNRPIARAATTVAVP
jgi:hypothetical protein